MPEQTNLELVVGEIKGEFIALRRDLPVLIEQGITQRVIIHEKEYHGNGLKRQEEIDKRIDEKLLEYPMMQSFTQRKINLKCAIQTWGPVLFTAAIAIWAILQSIYAGAGGK